MRRAVIVPAVAGALLVGGAPLAAAAPPEPEIITLECGEETFDVVVKGNGQWSPGRVVGTKQVVIPLSFGEFFFHAETPQGIVFEFTEPGAAKGGGKAAAGAPHERLTCSFEITEVLTEGDPELDLPPGTVATFGGTVTVMVVGR